MKRKGNPEDVFQDEDGNWSVPRPKLTLRDKYKQVMNMNKLISKDVGFGLFCLGMALGSILEYLLS